MPYFKREVIYFKILLYEIVRPGDEFYLYSIPCQKVKKEMEFHMFLLDPRKFLLTFAKNFNSET